MMNSSSNSSGKRPMEGLIDTSNSTSSGGDVLCGGDTSRKSADNCNDTTQKFHEMMREVRDINCSNGKFDTLDDSSSDDEEDIPEIVDLQKALEYLVSERDIEKIYNGIISTSNSNATAQSDKEKNTNDNDEQLNMIPNLVNRILMECYSHQPTATNQQQQNDTSCAQKEISRKQRHKLTQLLLAVIVEFAEPYFVREAQYKDQERARKIQQKKQKKEMQADDEMNKKISALPKEDNTSDPSLEFDKRAISWATSCIKQLIEYPGSSISSSGIGSLIGSIADENDQQMSLEDHHIPELDALLASTGKHDAMEMEQDFQRAILQGLQSRLLHMGIE